MSFRAAAKNSMLDKNKWVCWVITPSANLALRQWQCHGLSLKNQPKSIKWERTDFVFAKFKSITLRKIILTLFRKGFELHVRVSQVKIRNDPLFNAMKLTGGIFCGREMVVFYHFCLFLKPQPFVHHCS